MQAKYHIATSALASVGVYYGTGSWPAAAACMVSGVLVDLDHVPDYLVEHGPKLDYKFFMSSFPEGRYERIYLFLHAWEWVIAGSIAVALTGWHPIATGLLLGYGIHMILDQLINQPMPLTYFLTWRASKRFKAYDVFRKFANRLP